MGFPVTGMKYLWTELHILGLVQHCHHLTDILLFTQEFFADEGEVYLKRDFSSSLVTNDIFSIDFASGSSSANANFSISLCNSSNSELIKVSHSGSDSNFKINDGGTEIDTGASFTQDTKYVFSITYLGSNNYTWSINGNDSSTLTSTNNLASNLNSIKIYAHDLGVGKTIGFDNVKVDSSVLNSNETIYNTDVSLVDLTINSGATLTINSTGSLTVSDDFVNNGSIVMNSASNEFPSLIVGSKAGSGHIHTTGMSQTLALSILFLLLLQNRLLVIFCLITLV